MLLIGLQVERFWQPSFDAIKLVQSSVDRNLPKDTLVDSNVLG